jgi:ribonuclease HI
VTTAVIYTDGSGTTGGPAGIAFVGLVSHDRMDKMPVEGSLELRNATNQQAEILAAEYALHELPPCDEVIVYSDSEYLVLGMQGRLERWIANGWRTNGGPVANPAQWRRLLAAAERHTEVEFRWCKGHAGNEFKERADELAVAARHRASETAPC